MVGPVLLVPVYSGRAEEVEGADAFLEAARATGDDYTLAGALTLVAVGGMYSADLEGCRPFAEEATQIAQRIGNPTLIAMSGTYLGAALETADPPAPASILETAVEYGRAVASGVHLTTALGWLARISADAARLRMGNASSAAWSTWPTKPATPPPS